MYRMMRAGAYPGAQWPGAGRAGAMPSIPGMGALNGGMLGNLMSMLGYGGMGALAGVVGRRLDHQPPEPLEHGVGGHRGDEQGDRRDDGDHEREDGGPATGLGGGPDEGPADAAE